MPFEVTHSDVQLDPRLESGTVTISARLNGEDVEAIELNRGGLAIDRVEEDGRPRRRGVRAGIRRYTTTHFGKSVTTADFRGAMEQTSGTDLGGFFDRWVYR